MRVFIWLAGVFLAIIVIVLLILGITRPNNNSSTTTESKPLSSYANSDAVVTYTTSGRIVSNEDHREIVITVTRNSATLQIVQGYQGNVISASSFTNNEAAFSSFLAAIDKAGFTESRIPAGSKDIAGQCPLGNRYIYATRGVSGVTEDLWSASCSNREGTFAGNASTIRQLFQRQIPNYSTLVRGVSL